MKILGLKIVTAVLSLCCFVSAANATLITRFTVVDSSPTSWIARGLQDYTVSPETGWIFDASRNFDNGISFRITGPALPGTSINRWFIDFGAPFDNELTSGFYENFQRWPFHDADRPGLAFGSTGRLDNRASGFFEILEATYSDLGEVLSFAADFTHYGETLADRYAVAELRYNYTAVSEPSSLVLLSLGALLFGIRRRTHK